MEPTSIEIDPKLLKANPWNSNKVSPENLEKIRNSLERNGFIKPVIVREIDEGFEIIGGEHRVIAAIAAKMTSIPVFNLGPISDDKAKEIGLLDNERYGEDDPLQLSEILSTLGDLSTLSSILPYTTDELAEMTGDLDIDLDNLGLEDPDDDPEEDEEPTAGKKPAKTHQILRFKVPLEDVDDVTDMIDAIQREHGLTEADSLTNAGDALVVLIGMAGKETHE